MPLPQIVRFFLGCNTPDGFFSLFDQFTVPEAGYRCTLVKGGPGTGKSTLLRRLEKQSLLHGCTVEEIHCSSDADSLDGVVLPRERLVMLDATPPHALEPRHPGAVEQPLSLCDCWDSEALSRQREQIVVRSSEIAALHRQAIRYLSAAAGILREIRSLAEPHTSRRKIERYAHSIAEREMPDLKKTGSEQRRLLSAVTNQGPLLFSLSLEALAPKLTCIEDPYGVAAAYLIECLRTEALRRGYDIITCPCGLTPQQKNDHLLIPSLGLGYVTSNRFHPVTAPGRAVHAQRFTDTEAMKSCKVRVRFLQKTADMLLRQATAAMAAAKERHDALEKIYRAAMDFGKVDAIAEEACRHLAGRLKGPM